jgi:putative spermidine/putrescine transport system substrate-binding protein
MKTPSIPVRVVPPAERAATSDLVDAAAPGFGSTALRRRTAMRTILGALAFGAGPAVHTSRASAQAKPTVTIYDVASGANFQQFFRRILPEADRALNIEIRYLPGSAAEVEQRLRAGQANQDIVLCNEFVVANFIRAGIGLVDLRANAAAIPNMALVESAERDTVVGVQSEGRGVPFWRHQQGIVYDSARIPNPPTSWQDFVARRREYDGHIGIVRPDAGPPPGRYMIYDFLRGHGVNESLPLAELMQTPEFRSAIEKFREFSQSFYKPPFSAPPQMFQQYAAGNVWIGELPIDFALWSRDQDLLPRSVKATFFPTPMVNGAAWMTIPSNIPVERQRPAFVLINWLLSPAIQGRLLSEMHQYPAISAWNQMPQDAFRDIPTWEQISAIRKPLANGDLFNWITENGAGLLAR